MTGRSDFTIHLLYSSTTYMCANYRSLILCKSKLYRMQFCYTLYSFGCENTYKGDNSICCFRTRQVVLHDCSRERIGWLRKAWILGNGDSEDFFQFLKLSNCIYKQKIYSEMPAFQHEHTTLFISVSSRCTRKKDYPGKAYEEVGRKTHIFGQLC